MEKKERDEEEEWGTIPIPQSDDSDSTDEWLSEEPNEYESTSTYDQDQNKKGYLNCFMAFLIAPRKDGRVLTKDGQIIDVNDCSAQQQQENSLQSHSQRIYLSQFSLSLDPIGHSTSLLINANS